MTVKELREALADLPDGYKVLVSDDCSEREVDEPFYFDPAGKTVTL